MITINIPRQELDLDYISAFESSILYIEDIYEELKESWNMCSTLKKLSFPMTNQMKFIDQWSITKESQKTIITRNQIEKSINHLGNSRK